MKVWLKNQYCNNVLMGSAYVQIIDTHRHTTLVDGLSVVVVEVTLQT